MTYLEIYKKLQRVEGITQLNRLRMAYRIGHTLPVIRKAIIEYLDCDIPESYQYPDEISLTIKEVADGEETVVGYSADAIQQKFQFPTPLATLLYIDWLLKDPDTAILYSKTAHNVITPSREEIEAHIDPRILELAKKKEQAMIQALESKLDEEITDPCTTEDSGAEDEEAQATKTLE